MYEFWYNYIMPKYRDRAKLCYTDNNSFITYIKTEDFFEDISNDVEKWFDTSNYNKKSKILILMGKKKVPGLFKDELEGKIITEFVALRRKTYSYLGDNCNENKKAKGTKKCAITQKIMFVCTIIKMFIDHKKDLKAIIMMFTQKKLIRLH